MRLVRWILGILTLLVFTTVAIGWFSILSGPTIDQDSTLLVTLDGPLPESPTLDLGVLLGGEPQQTLRSLLFNLERAAEDDRIKGVVLNVKQPQIGFGQLQEVASAMARFRESGKYSIGFMETAGEISRGDGALALASLADEIVVTPPGNVNLIGLRAEPMFYAGTFDKLDIDVHFEKRGQYKSAANQFTHTKMDKPTRTSLQDLFNDIQDGLTRLIARRRKVQVPVVEEWINRGPYTSQEAESLGIVDRVAYWDEILTDLSERAGREDSLVSAGTYWSEKKPHNTGEKIALIYGEGPVMRGESDSALSGDAVMASTTLTGAFRDIRKSGAKAVVFRVDSPGGSYIASDLIRREVELTKKAGIPVVVSMGNVAASGGYFVSMEADHILSNGGTITGSIGVYTGVVDLTGAYAMLGITSDPLQTAPNADTFSALAPIDERRKRISARFADRVYEDFTKKVSENRKLTRTEVETVAQGRVWSGRAALERSLVDSLGGLRDAMEKAKALAEINANTSIDLDVWPRADDPTQTLRNILRGTIQTAKTLDRARAPLAAAARLWHPLGASEDDAPLLVRSPFPQL